MLIFFRRILRSSSLFIFVTFSSSSHTFPAVGSIKRFNMRTSVDFPLPESTMLTKTSPDFTSKDARLTPTVIPVNLRMSSFVLFSSKYFIACCGRLLNIFVKFSTFISLIVSPRLHPYHAGCRKHQPKLQGYYRDIFSPFFHWISVLSRMLLQNVSITSNFMLAIKRNY